MQGIHHNLHAGVIHDEFLVFDGRELRRYCPDRSQEQAVGKLHDVGFVDGVDFLPAMAHGVFKRKFRNPRGSLFRDDFQALDHSGNDFVLEA